ncbi:MAG: hypothetical protein ACFFC6_08615 [Promethearchaeota archaeon]
MVCARPFNFVFLTFLLFSFVLTIPASNQNVNGNITQISKNSLVYGDPLLFIFCFFIKCSKITVHFEGTTPNFQFHLNRDVNNSQYKYNLTFTKIIEYIDNNSDNLYNESEDTAIKEIDLGLQSFTKNESIGLTKEVYNFTTTFSTTEFNISITVRNDGSTAYAKVGMGVTNWSFAYKTNRFVIITPLILPFLASDYNFTSYSNQTVTLIHSTGFTINGTLTNRIVKIDNPNQADTPLEKVPVKLNAFLLGNKLILQYNFPNFDIEEKSTTTGTNGVSGFGLLSIFVLIPMTIFLRKRKQ